MQYLLDPEEYAYLRQSEARAADKVAKILGGLCKRVACSEPLDIKPKPWNKGWIESVNGKPWGCIHVPEHDSGYCDECPVKEMCPLPHKFSK